MSKFKIKFTERDTEDYKNWLSFYPKKSNFRFDIREYGYFDPRPQLITNVTTILFFVGIFCTGFSIWSLIFLPLLIFGWGDIYLNLPIDTGMTDESDGECSWGVYFYHCENPWPMFREIWITWGHFRKHIEMPWALSWYRTSTKLDDGSWFNEIKGKKKKAVLHYLVEKEKIFLFKEFYDYKYKLRSGEIQERTACVGVKQMEWRRKWLMFTSLFSKVRTTIDIEFSDEVGERTGSWKGGTIGCGYELLLGETPLACLRRMERERTF